MIGVGIGRVWNSGSVGSIAPKNAKGVLGKWLVGNDRVWTKNLVPLVQWKRTDTRWSLKIMLLWKCVRLKSSKKQLAISHTVTSKKKFFKSFSPSCYNGSTGDERLSTNLYGNLLTKGSYLPFNRCKLQLVTSGADDLQSKIFIFCDWLDWLHRMIRLKIKILSRGTLQ